MSADRIEIGRKAAVSMLRHGGRVQVSHLVSEQQLAAVLVDDGPGVLHITRCAVRVLQRVAEPLEGYVLVMLHQCTLHQCLPQPTQQQPHNQCTCLALKVSTMVPWEVLLK